MRHTCSSSLPSPSPLSPLPLLSVATMDQCIHHFLRATSCSKSEALHAASLHPAQALGLQDRKGTLACGADADLVILDQQLNVQATVIAGEPVWTLPGSSIHTQC